jgi:hypothetical protein
VPTDHLSARHDRTATQVQADRQAEVPVRSDRHVAKLQAG